MGRRVPRVVWTGVGLILLGIAAHIGVDRWIHTRVVHPVDIPVSLAVGHLHTGPFALNLYADYRVDLSIGDDWRWDSAHPECNPYRHLQTRWVLYQKGKVVDRLDQPVVLPWPSGFTVGPGVYDLDVEVMSDFKCLDPVHPHLEVNAITENYESGVFLLKAFAVMCGILGGILTFQPVVHAVIVREKSASLLGSVSISREFSWARTFPLRRPFSSLPAFGLYAGLLYGVLALMIMLLTALTQPPPPVGWRVHLLKPGQFPTKSDSWTEPLTVAVRFTEFGHEPDLLVNGKQVAWSDLDHVLEQELGRRRDWTVYVSGDDYLSFSDVARVIDAARGLHANVFLITKRTTASPY